MSSYKKQKKRMKHSIDLKQYYADDIAETEEKGYKKPLKITNTIIEGSEESCQESTRIEDDMENENKLRQKNMDKISDILVSMIFKNKVNPKNAFDIPLPDVKKLSDFKFTGDISWKKLSQTLDAGAKIYGFRVDSVHNEVYKVLGGLNRTQLGEEVTQENQVQENEQEFDQGVKKQRKELGGESTIEKNMNNIDTNRYDVEFDIDPLFRKTSAKFDEAGPRGLLLNNLCINSQLNLMFDSSYSLDFNSLEIQETESQAIKKTFLKNIVAFLKNFSEDSNTLKLCPELTLFKQSYLRETKEFGEEIFQNDKTIMANKNSEAYSAIQLKFADINFDAEQILSDFGQNFEDRFNEPELCFDEISQGLLKNNFGDSQALTSEKCNGQRDSELNFSCIEGKLAFLGFGQAFEKLIPDHQSWMGPEGWKLKMKKNNERKKNLERTQKKEGKPKKDTEICIDFNMKLREEVADVFGVTSTSKKQLNPKFPRTKTTEPEIKQFFLLPADMKIKPLRLTNLFQRGLTKYKQINSNQSPAIQTDKIWHKWGQDGDDVEEEQIDFQAQNDMQHDLDVIFGSANHTDIMFDQPERYINIKALKDRIWKYLSDKIPVYSDNTNSSNLISPGDKNLKHNQEGDTFMTFSDVYKDIKQMENFQTKNISVHSCLVTILHLANEKNLKFININNEDFQIFRSII